MRRTRRDDVVRLAGELEVMARERDSGEQAAPGSPGVAARRAMLLERVNGARLVGTASRRAKAVSRLHDLALFHAAYPDDLRVHAAAEAVLADLPRRVTGPVAEKLSGTGIAGTAITYGFDYPIAAWVSDRAGEAVALAWDEIEDETPLLRLLPFLAGAAEDAAIDDPDVGVRDYVDAARGRNGDLAWLVKRLEALETTPRARAHLYDGLGLTLAWRLSDTRISRTGARWADSPIGCHPGPLRRRVDLARTVFAPTRGRRLAGAAAEKLIDLARAALASREREMFPISHASASDTWIYDAGHGLQVAVYGTRMDRRLLLESLWGFLFLKNGIPLGYGCFSTLFGSSEVALNIFESFRAGESAVTYAALLRVIHAHSGATSFSALKYQIGGDENEEAIAAGAFWFYHKLGFRPFDPGALKLLAREEARIAARPGYRSPASVLRTFAKHNIYLCLGPRTRDLLGHVPYGKLGLVVTRALAKMGGDRETAVETLCRSAEAFLGEKMPRGSELVRELCVLVSLAGTSRAWTTAEKRSLAASIRLKAASTERDFCLAMNSQTKFKEAILTLLKR